MAFVFFVYVETKNKINKKKNKVSNEIKTKLGYLLSFTCLLFFFFQRLFSFV